MVDDSRELVVGVIRPLLVGGFFMPNGAERLDLIASGWTPPAQVEKPKVHRRYRLILAETGDDGPCLFGPYSVAFGIPDLQQPIASAIVELTEGVFDAEWKR